MSRIICIIIVFLLMTTNGMGAQSGGAGAPASSTVVAKKKSIHIDSVWQKMRSALHKSHAGEKGEGAEKASVKGEQTTGDEKATDGRKGHATWIWTAAVIAIAVLSRFLFRRKRRSRQQPDRIVQEHAPAPSDAGAPRSGVSLSPEDQPHQGIETLLSQPEDNKLVVDETPFEIDSKAGKATAFESDDWMLVGASVQGNGHIQMKIPCQDNHAYESLGYGWGIAIVSDGAGSASLSHKGSAIVAMRGIFHFKALVEREGWIQKKELPGEGEWMKHAYRTLKLVRNDMAAFAQKLQCAAKDLSATAIVVIHSPYGLLVTHVGDGRAGYKDLKGNWLPLITPHKGEEANQTLFLQSDFWNIPFLELSGVLVPESIVLRQPVAAFTLMSDGCENTSWLCNQYNEATGKYFDPNLPFAKFYNQLIPTLQAFYEDGISLEERKKKWYSFLKNGNKAFIKETDDKTMILVIRKQISGQV